MSAMLQIWGIVELSSALTEEGKSSRFQRIINRQKSLRRTASWQQVERYISMTFCPLISTINFYFFFAGARFLSR